MALQPATLWQRPSPDSLDPRQVAPSCPLGWEHCSGDGVCEPAGLTSSLTSRRMEGWSGMALKRVPTTQHFSPGCSSHSFFTRTPLPGVQRECAQRPGGPPLPHEARAQSSLSTVALGPCSPPRGREHQMQGPPGPKGSAPGGQRGSGCRVSLQERQTCREGSVKMVQGQRPEGCGHRPAVRGQSPEARRAKEGSEGA